MGIIEGVYKVDEALGRGDDMIVPFKYDFALDGGAIGSIPLRGAPIPAGATLTDAILFVQTPLASASGTAALTAVSAGDVQAAAAAAGAPWSTATPKRCSALTAVSAPIVVAVGTTPVLTVATGALTAGKFTLALYFVYLGP